jgi:hypothetical protein
MLDIRRVRGITLYQASRKRIASESERVAADAGRSLDSLLLILPVNSTKSNDQADERIATYSPGEPVDRRRP